ncbi:hypothetical protein ACQY0O_002596 [Thecaphora frezii]
MLASNAADAAAFEVLETHRASLVTHTLELRRTLHAARLVATEVEGGMMVTQQVQLEEDMDELVDILSAVGRRAANVQAKNVRTSKEMQSVVRQLKWLDGSHPSNLAIKDDDSGVEL